jgi:hypothetical protein
LHLAKEIRSIQRRAAEHDCPIVSIGPLVFFSTETGCAIGWQGHDRIEGELFTCEERSSQRRIAIGGYPVHLLRRVISEADHP